MAEPSSIWLELKTNLQSAAGWIARSASIGNVVALSWIVIWVVICVLVVQDLTRDVVTIEPISVPKSLSDIGYTPEVASHRLRDAVKHYASVNRASKLMDALSIAPSDELDKLPEFVVPKIDLSLNALVSSIRSVLRSGRSISGEFLLRDKLALRLRVDGPGHHVYSSEFDSENPDDLLANAAPFIAEKIQPCVGAIVLYHDHPEQAVEKADDIIARLKESDVNVQCAYLLKGNHLFDQGNYAESEKALRKAVSLNWSNPTPHISLGRTLQRLGRSDDAIAQYQRAIGIDPKSAQAYNNWGYVLLGSNGNQDDAVAKFQRAIELDSKYALPHNNLGLALYHQGKMDEAIAEYRHAIALDPKYARPHNNLGLALLRQGNADEAIAEYHHAIELDPKYANPHANLGAALLYQGKVDEAVAEYRRAAEIDAKYATAHNSLGLALSRQGKVDEAIAEFRRAIESQPD